MSCNPCCCLKLKDAAISIGIWSTIYSLVQIALFGWQFSVLAQCQHVIMAQSNLQCDYYCPCVGASTARTSAIIEGILLIYSIMQLAIFGWQMAAIKYEKDRAANTLLPNYNTYGRYDIPTYYESYWQSPEERYYTWLFVIQILCLIAAFFLLFASLMMIYGVHTWSRYLLVPWMVTMCASILTSFAYCLIWWAGDVRDYWLLLTIVQMFGVFINCYCFLVIIVFHRRMLVELEYYARRRKYDRFSQMPCETPQQQTEKQTVAEVGETDEEQQMRNNGSRRETLAYKRQSQLPYQQHQLARNQQMTEEEEKDHQMNGHFGGAGAGGQHQQQREMHTTTLQRTTPTAEQQRHQRKAVESSHILPYPNQIRSFSAMEHPLQKTQFDEYREMPTRDKRRRSTSHRQKDRSVHRFHCCHAVSKHCHCHRHSAERHRKESFSSTSSSNSALGEYSAEELPKFGRRPSRKGRQSWRKRSRERPWGHNCWSDKESDLSEFGHTVQKEREYGNVESLERRRRGQTRGQFLPYDERRREQKQSRKGRMLFQSNDERPISSGRLDSTGGSTLPRAQQQKLALSQPTAGISIPQHIVIPPAAQLDGQMSKALAERKYRINSEITVSYDPKGHQTQTNGRSLSRRKPPEIPPRTHHSAGYINLNTSAVSVSDSRREPTQQKQQLISMHSNV